jgi:hypothetical protein
MNHPPLATLPTPHALQLNRRELLGGPIHEYELAALLSSARLARFGVRAETLELATIRLYPRCGFSPARRRISWCNECSSGGRLSAASSAGSARVSFGRVA